MDLQKAAEIDQGIADLKILQNRLRTGLAKSERGDRAMARFARLVRKYEKRWRRPVAQWLAEMRARLDAGLRRNAGAMLTEPSVDKLIDWDEFDKWTINHFKPIMSETLAGGGNSVMRERRVAKAGGGFDPLTQAALDWLTIHALDLVHDINGKSRAGLIQMILEGIKAGTNPRDIARKLRKYVGITGKMAQAAANREAWLIINRPELGPAAIKGAMDAYTRKQIRYRAEMISRTETAYGLNEGIREGYGQLGYTKLQRIEDPVGDDEWDCTCRENNGAIYTLAESQGVLPEHPNCVTGDMRIIAPGMKWVYSASYNGPIFRIVFEGGVITITSKHQLLTTKGFVSACDLRKGDQIIYCRAFEREVFGNPNDDGKPPRIDQVITALSKKSGMTAKIVPLAPEYFHGDGSLMDGDVNIIAADGLLLGDFKPGRTKGGSENRLATADPKFPFFAGFSDLLPMLTTLALSSDSIMGGRNNPGPIDRRNDVIPHVLSDLSPRSEDNPGIQKPPDNGLSAATKAFRNTIERFSSEITPLDIIDIKIVFHKDPQIVYDLETTSSLYLCNGLISSNCEGTWVAYSG